MIWIIRYPLLFQKDKLLIQSTRDFAINSDNIILDVVIEILWFPSNELLSSHLKVQIHVQPLGSHMKVAS